MKSRPTFAATLQRLAREGAHTITSIAGATGLPYQTIYRYWHGQRCPHFDNLRKIAEALGVSLSVFDGVT